MQDRFDLAQIILSRDSPAPSHHILMALTLHPKKSGQGLPLDGPNSVLKIPVSPLLLLTQHLPEQPMEDFFLSFVSLATKSKYPLVFLEEPS